MPREDNRTSKGPRVEGDGMRLRTITFKSRSIDALFYADAMFARARVEAQGGKLTRNHASELVTFEAKYDHDSALSARDLKRLGMNRKALQ